MKSSRKKSKEFQGSLEETIQEVEKRDRRDEEREISPLKKAQDACCIDTTNMTIKQVVRAVVSIATGSNLKRPSMIWSFLVGKERARANFFYKSVWLFTYLIYRLLYRIETKGVENYPRGAAIIAPNHISYLDPPAIALACPSEVHALGIDYLFKTPILGWVLRHLNTHPVSGDGSDLKVLKLVTSLLQSKKQVIIFPEGSRSKNNEILPLKRGIGLLASASGCCVVPTHIKGPYEIWPKKNKTPRLFGKILVTFGKPIYWDEIEKRTSSKKEAQHLLVQELEEALKKMHREAYKGY